MTTLLDEETTVILDALDFEIPCGMAAHAEADVSVTCRACGNGAYLCSEHLEWSRGKFVLLLTLGGQPWCIKCHAQADTYDELFEVIPL